MTHAMLPAPPEMIHESESGPKTLAEERKHVEQNSILEEAERSQLESLFYSIMIHTLATSKRRGWSQDFSIFKVKFAI